MNGRAIHTSRANEGNTEPAFCGPSEISATTIVADHNGRGPIAVRRLMARSPSSAIDFVDYTVIPPGSSIGRHQHVDSEELYLIVDGRPIVLVEAVARRLRPGDVAIVRANQCHELMNDTSDPVTLFIVQVALYTPT